MSTPQLPKTIALIGMTNSGKSYWSEILEKGYGYHRVSIDEEIMRLLNKQSLGEVTEWLGSPTSQGYFDRQNEYLHLEERALEVVLDRIDPTVPTVIDTTGSVVFLSIHIQEKLTSRATVVWLHNETKSIAQRVIEYTASPKPVIWRNYYEGDLETSYKNLLRARVRIYSLWAHVKIDVSKVETAEEFVDIIAHAKIWPYEFFLQKEILPILERGRPNWDRLHTESVVSYIKKITREHPALQVDVDVLLVTAYLHDYGYSELYRGTEAQYDRATLKRMHAKRSLEKWLTIQNNNEFVFLTPERKQNIAHLIEVHDELESVSSVEEKVFVEADTLGALATNLEYGGYHGSELFSYLKSVHKKRLPLFINAWSQSEARTLIGALTRRESWWRRLFWRIF